MFSVLTWGCNNHDANLTEFLCDDASDISSLPVDGTVAVGSKAVVVSTKQIYILNNNREWEALCGANHIISM